MKTQTHLSELDATKLANLKLRQQLLTNEYQALCADIAAAYANPGEDLSVAMDGITLIRKPGKPAEKTKGKRT